MKGRISQESHGQQVASHSEAVHIVPANGVQHVGIGGKHDCRQESGARAGNPSQSG